MRSLRLLAVLGAVVLTTGCSQKQQESISSSTLLNTAESGFYETVAKTEAWVNSTGFWIDAELARRNLESRVDGAIRDQAVTPKQAAGLRESVEYIRKLQQTSIRSGNGIDKSEGSKISAAVRTVEKRLDGLVAAKPKQTQKPKSSVL